MQQKFNTVPLTEGCKALGISLQPEQRQKMVSHLELLSKWNRRLNLTAVRSYRDLTSHHILDSLSINSYLRGTTLLDIGTGAGFPGLPLATLNPDLEVTLLDSRNKRIEFLRHVISINGIENVVLEHCRIENFRPTRKFDTLAARAFTSLAEMVSLCEGLLVSGTRLLAQKGRYPQQELDSLPAKIQSNVTVEKLAVPFLDAERHLVIMDF